MLSDKTLLRVLGDTRCADQVIRLSPDAAPGMEPGKPFIPSDIYNHEWVHYFQFSACFSGVVLSYYRRESFNHLKRALIGAPDGNFNLADFYSDLALVRARWQAWPPDWHRIGQSGSPEIASVEIESSGVLRVAFKGSDLGVELPLGIHAIYEAMAWCAAAASSAEDYLGSIPRNAESLIYTWPLWLRAGATGSDLDDLDIADLMGVLPLLLITTAYDYRLIPETTRFSAAFREVQTGLENRKVTMGRLTWQLFRDYDRFWNGPLRIERTDAYLKRIGLPPLSTMFAMAAEFVDVVLQDRQTFLMEVPGTMPEGFAPMLDEILAEIDLLQTSALNIERTIAEADMALISPVVLQNRLVPPVCAVEDPRGYRWFGMTFLEGQSELTERSQRSSRTILREQLSITEHIMMQLALGSPLACYGPIDWHFPINDCPVAQTCMARQEKRGIEFCEDPAWRQRVGGIAAGLFNHHDSSPPEALIPGITAAVGEFNAAQLGEGPQFERAHVDYDALNLTQYITRLDP